MVPPMTASALYYYLYSTNNKVSEQILRASNQSSLFISVSKQKTQISFDAPFTVFAFKQYPSLNLSNG